MKDKIYIEMNLIQKKNITDLEKYLNYYPTKNEILLIEDEDERLLNLVKCF